MQIFPNLKKCKLFLSPTISDQIRDPEPVWESFSLQAIQPTAFSWLSRACLKPVCPIDIFCYSLVARALGNINTGPHGHFCTLLIYPLTTWCISNFLRETNQFKIFNQLESQSEHRHCSPPGMKRLAGWMESRPLPRNSPHQEVPHLRHPWTVWQCCSEACVLSSFLLYVHKRQVHLLSLYCSSQASVPRDGTLSWNF